MRDGDFIFDFVCLLYYKYHKINLNCIDSYIDSPERIKSKKAVINSDNKNANKFFQCDVTIT